MSHWAFDRRRGAAVTILIAAMTFPVASGVSRRSTADDAPTKEKKSSQPEEDAEDPPKPRNPSDQTEVNATWKGVEKFVPFKEKKHQHHRRDAKVRVTAVEKNHITVEYWVEDKDAKGKLRGIELELTRSRNQLRGKAKKFLGKSEMKHFGGGGLFDVVWEGKFEDDDARLELHTTHPGGARRAFEGTLISRTP